jgi:hypothetical protein
MGRRLSPSVLNVALKSRVLRTIKQTNSTRTATAAKAHAHTKTTKSKGADKSAYCTSPLPLQQQCPQQRSGRGVLVAEEEASRKQASNRKQFGFPFFLPTHTKTNG